MTDIAAARNMIGHMKLNNDASNVYVAYKYQGFSLMNGFAHLDEKSMETLCRVLHIPGGSKTGVSFNNGFSVSAISETNI